MGSVIVHTIMHGSPSLPLILLFFISSADRLVLSEDTGECSALSLANVRKIIPADAVQARQVLHKIWKLSQKDVCRSTFQQWQHSPISARSSRALGRRKSEGRMTMGEFLKYQMGEIKKDLEKKIWESWVSNIDLKGMQGTEEEIALRINQTMEKKLGNMEHWNYEYNLQYLPEILISQFEEIVPSLSFLDNFELNREDVKEAIQGIACSLQSSKSALELEFGAQFDKVMDTEGVENADVANLKDVAGNFMHEILREGVTPLLDDIMQKLRSLVYKLIPEFNEFHSFSMEPQSGKNIELENLLLKIPKNADKVIGLLDDILVYVCKERDLYLKEIFSSSFFTFFHLASSSVDDNNKIDLNKLVELFAENHTEEFIKTKLGSVAEIVDQIFSKLEERGEGGFLGFRLIELLYKLGSPEQHKNHHGSLTVLEEKFNVRAEVLEAGAVQFLLEYLF